MNRATSVAAIALTAMLAGCASSRIMAGTEKDHQRSIAAADGVAKVYANQPCPAFGTKPSASPETRWQELSNQLATAKQSVTKAVADYSKSVAYFDAQGHRDQLSPQFDTMRDAASAKVYVAANTWEQAVVSTLASNQQALDPARPDQHPVWRARSAYQPTLESLRNEVKAYENLTLTETSAILHPWKANAGRGKGQLWGTDRTTLTPSRYQAAIDSLGQHITSCAESYKGPVISANASAISTYAARLKSTQQIDKLSNELGLSRYAAVPEIASLTIQIAEVRTARLADERKAADAERQRQEAERQRQEAERQRLAEQTRQAQLAAAEAQRQRDLAAAKARAEIERQQEAWRSKWAASHKAANYKCEGGTYTKGVPLAPARGKYDRVQFYIRLPPDHRFIEITQSSGTHGFASGRRDIKFTSPTAVTFTFNHREGGVLGMPERLWPGSVTIDLVSGKVTGSFSYMAQPLNVSLSTSYEMYCAKD